MELGYAPELEGEKEPAYRLVERLAEGLRTAGFKADIAIEVGDARERIIDSAEDKEPDFIVVGSHERRYPPFLARQRLTKSSLATQNAL